MDAEFLELAWNASMVIADLKPGQSITREDLIDALRRSRPDPEHLPSEATVHHALRFYVRHAGIDNAATVVTFHEASRLTGRSETSIRQAAYRGRPLVSLDVHFQGRDRRGVTLVSLAAWMRWPHHEFKEAARRVAEWREADR